MALDDSIKSPAHVVIQFIQSAASETKTIRNNEFLYRAVVGDWSGICGRTKPIVSG